jgi:hypothetical protein
MLRRGLMAMRVSPGLSHANGAFGSPCHLEGCLEISLWTPAGDGYLGPVLAGREAAEVHRRHGLDDIGPFLAHDFTFHPNTLLLNKGGAHHQVLFSLHLACSTNCSDLSCVDMLENNALRSPTPHLLP